MLDKKKEVSVGIAADGFTIYVGAKRFRFSQEESNEELWKETFKELGFDVTITEDY